MTPTILATGYGVPTTLTLEDLRDDVRELKRVAWSHTLSSSEQTHLAACERELVERTQIVISGAEARDLIGWVVTYVRPTYGWSEVQVMDRSASGCDHGCKLYVRENSAKELVFQLTHSVVYGCQLGRDHDLRSVPVKVDPGV